MSMPRVMLREAAGKNRGVVEKFKEGQVSLNNQMGDLASHREYLLSAVELVHAQPSEVKP